MIHEDREGLRAYKHSLYARGLFLPKSVHTRTEIDLVPIVIDYTHEVVFLLVYKKIDY